MQLRAAMKKSNNTKSTYKLALRTETVRSLRDVELSDAAGGRPNPTISLCATECFPTARACTTGNSVDCTF
jgi:hypothetical protein